MPSLAYKRHFIKVCCCQEKKSQQNAQHCQKVIENKIGTVIKPWFSEYRHNRFEDERCIHSGLFNKAKTGLFVHTPMEKGSLLSNED